jgi:hypothetical protein
MLWSGGAIAGNSQTKNHDHGQSRCKQGRPHRSHTSAYVATYALSIENVAPWTVSLWPSRLASTAPLSRSHSTHWCCSVIASSSFPSGLNTTSDTANACSSVATHAPSATSHTRAVQSNDAVATSRSSGLNAPATTPSVCPKRTATVSHAAVSQSRAVQSLETVSTRAPSPLMYTALTPPLCVRLMSRSARRISILGSCSSPPAATVCVRSHRLHVLSNSTTAAVRHAASTATDLTLLPLCSATAMAHAHCVPPPLSAQRQMRWLAAAVTSALLSAPTCSHLSDEGWPLTARTHSPVATRHRRSTQSSPMLATVCWSGSTCARRAAAGGRCAARRHVRGQQHAACPSGNSLGTLYPSI